MTLFRALTYGRRHMTGWSGSDALQTAVQQLTDARDRQALQLATQQQVLTQQAAELAELRAQVAALMRQQTGSAPRQ